MRLAGLLISAAVMLGPGCRLWAADFSDPTWPCVQRKVEQLSVGLMWPHPIPETELARGLSGDASDLVERLALRRLDLTEVQPALDAFVDRHSPDPAVMGQVFAKLFDRLSRTRSTIIEGIGAYSLQQIALSEQIDQKRAEMDTLLAAEAPDYDKIDALEAQIDWDERIFQDRQRSLTYVCETPVLIEKRLFGAAQMLQAATGN